MTPLPACRAVLAVVLVLPVAHVAAQATQADAFNDGKAYKPANAGIKASISPAAAALVPGQDQAKTNGLKGLYGTNLTGPGNDKVSACAAFVPGTDAYKNQECETVNYISKHSSTRPRYTIDKVTDPVIVRSTNVRNTAYSYTGGPTGLNGSYSACTEKTTNISEKFDTERCQIGRTIVETQCSATLNVTYEWQRYAAQPGADLRYGKCDPGQLRGDQLSIPLVNAFRTEQVTCSARGHGTGAETLVWYSDCAGAETLHGYDASACSIKPDPAVSDPPRQVVRSCTKAPRTNENCFAPDGTFTAKVVAPVFRDEWDNSACVDLDVHGTTFRN